VLKQIVEVLFGIKHAHFKMIILKIVLMNFISAFGLVN